MDAAPVSAGFTDAAAALLGPRGWTTDAELIQPWLTDWRQRFTGRALGMASPADTAELAALVKLCAKHRVPIVPQGGNSGMSGGATPDATGAAIVLSTRRMAAIRAIDAEARTALCEAGVILEVLHHAAEAQGLRFPLTLGGKGSATVGGLISTNAGGTQVLRHGSMRALVLGLEAVLADGSIVSSMGKSLKDNAGYDWKQLMIGSEGTLGIVTRAVLRLRPNPRSAQTAMIASNSVEDVSAMLRLLQARLAGRLSSFELMWRNFYEFVTAGQRDKRPPPMPGGSGIYVLVEALGDDEEADAASFATALEELFERGLAHDAVIAQSERQRADLWATRDDLIDVMSAIKPRYAFDVSMALSDMARFVADTEARVAESLPGAVLMFYGHGGDGNLHVIVGPGERDGGYDMANDAVYAATRAVGGSISAEHGIGTYKKAYIGLTRSPTELDLMRRLKRALDPDDILNPGKVLPAA